MKISVIISTMLITQVSCGFFDVFQGAVLSVRDNIGKLFSDVVTDVKDTVDCTILAVEHVLSLSADASARYHEKCDRSTNNTDARTAPIQPTVAISISSNDDYLKNEIPKQIDARINDTLARILNGYSPHNQLEEIEKELAKETERLAEVSKLVKQELEKLSNEIHFDFKNIERNDSKPSVDNILEELKLLEAIEQNIRNTTEANEVHKLIDNVLKKLDNIETSESTENAKVKGILEDLEHNTNDTYTDIRQQLADLKIEEEKNLILIKNKLEEHQKSPQHLDYLENIKLNNNISGVPTNETPESTSDALLSTKSSSTTENPYDISTNSNVNSVVATDAIDKPTSAASRDTSQGLSTDKEYSGSTTTISALNSLDNKLPLVDDNKNETVSSTTTVIAAKSISTDTVDTESPNTTEVPLSQSKDIKTSLNNDNKNNSLITNAPVTSTEGLSGGKENPETAIDTITQTVLNQALATELPPSTNDIKSTNVTTTDAGFTITTRQPITQSTDFEITTANDNGNDVTTIDVTTTDATVTEGMSSKKENALSTFTQPVLSEGLPSKDDNKNDMIKTATSTKAETSTEEVTTEFAMTTIQPINHTSDNEIPLDGYYKNDSFTTNPPVTSTEEISTERESLETELPHNSDNKNDIVVTTLKTTTNEMVNTESVVTTTQSLSPSIETDISPGTDYYNDSIITISPVTSTVGISEGDDNSESNTATTLSVLNQSRDTDLLSSDDENDENDSIKTTATTTNDTLTDEMTTEPTITTSQPITQANSSEISLDDSNKDDITTNAPFTSTEGISQSDITTTQSVPNKYIDTDLEPKEDKNTITTTSTTQIDGIANIVPATSTGSISEMENSGSLTTTQSASDKSIDSDNVITTTATITTDNPTTKIAETESVISTTQSLSQSPETELSPNNNNDNDSLTTITPDTSTEENTEEKDLAITTTQPNTNQAFNIEVPADNDTIEDIVMNTTPVAKTEGIPTENVTDGPIITTTQSISQLPNTEISADASNNDSVKHTVPDSTTDGTSLAIESSEPSITTTTTSNQNVDTDILPDNQNDDITTTPVTTIPESITEAETITTDGPTSTLTYQINTNPEILLDPITVRSNSNNNLETTIASTVILTTTTTTENGAFTTKDYNNNNGADQQSIQSTKQIDDVSEITTPVTKSYINENVETTPSSVITDTILTTIPPIIITLNPQAQSETSRSKPISTTTITTTNDKTTSTTSPVTTSTIPIQQASSTENGAQDRVLDKRIEDISTTSVKPHLSTPSPTVPVPSLNAFFKFIDHVRGSTIPTTTRTSRQLHASPDLKPSLHLPLSSTTASTTLTPSSIQLNPTPPTKSSTHEPSALSKLLLPQGEHKERKSAPTSLDDFFNQLPVNKNKKPAGLTTGKPHVTPKTNNFDNADYNSFFHLPSKDIALHNQAVDDARKLIEDSERAHRVINSILNKNKGRSVFNLPKSLVG